MLPNISNIPDFPMDDQRPEADVAEGCRLRLAEKLNELLEVMNDIEAKGFVPQFALAKGPMGKQMITQLIIAKHYT